MLRQILNILATQMRLLEQDVEIRFSEEDEILMKLKDLYGVEQQVELEVEEPVKEEEEVVTGKRRASLKDEKQAKEEKKSKSEKAKKLAKKEVANILKTVVSTEASLAHVAPVCNHY